MKPVTCKAAIFRGVGEVDVVEPPYPRCDAKQAQKVCISF